MSEFLSRNNFKKVAKKGVVFGVGAASFIASPAYAQESEPIPEVIEEPTDVEQVTIEDLTAEDLNDLFSSMLEQPQLNDEATIEPIPVNDLEIEPEQEQPILRPQLDIMAAESLVEAIILSEERIAATETQQEVLDVVSTVEVVSEEPPLVASDLFIETIQAQQAEPAEQAPVESEPPTNNVYIVESGDTLRKIANKIAISSEKIEVTADLILDQLVSANDLINPDLIFAGQALQVPNQPTPAAVETVAEDSEIEKLEIKEAIEITEKNVNPPFVWPIEGEEYGPNGGCYNDYRDGGVRGHGGIDIGAPRGTPIKAMADGEVVFAGVSGTGSNVGGGSGYGNVVLLRHDLVTHNGQPLYTIYGHGENLPDLQVGQKVAQNDQILSVGNSGASFGDHLHFGVYDTIDFDNRTLPPSRSNAALNPLNLIHNEDSRSLGACAPGSEGDTVNPWGGETYAGPNLYAEGEIRIEEAPEVFEVSGLLQEQLDLINSFNLEPNQKQFLHDSVIAAKQVVHEGFNINAAVVVAQAIEETGWGKSYLAREANNMFGITDKGDRWQGETITREDRDQYGNPVDHEFIKFATIEEGFRYYGHTIEDLAWYSDAEQFSDDWQMFIHGLQSDVADDGTILNKYGDKRWAESTEYADKLTRIVTSYNLDYLTE